MYKLVELTKEELELKGAIYPNIDHIEYFVEERYRMDFFMRSDSIVTFERDEETYAVYIASCQTSEDIDDKTIIPIQLKFNNDFNTACERAINNFVLPDEYTSDDSNMYITIFKIVE